HGIQPLGQAHIGFVGRNLEASMAERLQLLLHGGNDLRMQMAGVDHGDAGGEVDVALAVFAPDLGVLRPLGVYCSRVSDTSRHGRYSALMKLCRTWHVEFRLPSSKSLARGVRIGARPGSRRPN